MAVYDFQAISTPIMESIQQHGALFSLCWDLAWWNLLAAQQGSCCQWTGHGGPAIDYSLPRSEHFLLHNFKGKSCIFLSNSNAPGTIRPKKLFAFAKLTNRRRHLASGTRQNWLELAWVLDVTNPQGWRKHSVRNQWISGWSFTTSECVPLATYSPSL